MNGRHPIAGLSSHGVVEQSDEMEERSMARRTNSDSLGAPDFSRASPTVAHILTLLHSPEHTARHSAEVSFGTRQK